MRFNVANTQTIGNKLIKKSYSEATSGNTAVSINFSAVVVAVPRAKTA